MKKIVSVFLIIMILFLPGCSMLFANNTNEVLKSFPNDMPPTRVIKTENFWATLCEDYSAKTFSVRIGETLDSLEEIYKVEGVNIWYFDVNDNAAVWCERTEDNLTFKVYDYTMKSIESFFQTDSKTNYQSMYVRIYNDEAYYTYFDYKNEEVFIYAYDINTKTKRVVRKVPFVEKKQPYSINVENEHLSFACSDEIQVINLKNNEILFKASLPDNIEYVYSSSYDAVNDVCAIYYADKDSEDIAYLKNGEKEITHVHSFPANYYAFRENVLCHDGHIYWILQKNVSGYVADHYSLIDYNYLLNTQDETLRTFDFYRDGNDMYLLRYDKREYDYINLCKKPLKKNTLD